MNQKNLKSWEVRLGPAQTVIVLGILTGSIAGAFYLGFHGGRTAGYDLAMSNAAASAVRLPIAADQIDSTNSEQIVSEVYAKLHDTKKAEPAQRDAAAAPELGTIETTEKAQLPEALTVEEEALPDGSESALNRAGEESSGDPRIDELLAPPAKNAREAKNDPFPPIGSARSDSQAGKPTLGSVAPSAREGERSQAPMYVAKESSIERIGAPAPVKEKAPAKAAEPPAAKMAPPPAEKAAAPQTQTAKTAEPKPVPAVKGNKVPKGWFAQVAAPKSPADADSMARKLRSAGFPVVIESAQVKGENYYRLLVGPEDNRQQAEELVKQLKREPYVKGAPFIRGVK